MSRVHNDQQKRLALQLQNMVQRTQKNLRTGIHHDQSTSVLGRYNQPLNNLTASFSNKKKSTNNSMNASGGAAITMTSMRQSNGSQSPHTRGIENIINNQPSISYPNDSARKASDDLHLYRAVSNVAEDLHLRSRSNLNLQTGQTNLRSIESYGGDIPKMQSIRPKTQASIEPDFKTIYRASALEGVDYSDIAQRQRIFEDVIIQRIKVIQEYVRRLSQKSKKSVQQNEPSSTQLDISFPADSKIEEILKWKIEASERKLIDRLMQSESKQHVLQKHLGVVSEECQSEFKTIKNLIVQMTSEILEQVQTEILPQAEQSQAETLRLFRIELIQLLNQRKEDSSVQMRLETVEQQVIELTDQITQQRKAIDQLKKSITQQIEEQVQNSNENMQLTIDQNQRLTSQKIDLLSANFKRNYDTTSTDLVQKKFETEFADLRLSVSSQIQKLNLIVENQMQNVQQEQQKIQKEAESSCKLVENRLKASIEAVNLIVEKNQSDNNKELSEIHQKLTEMDSRIKEQLKQYDSQEQNLVKQKIQVNPSQKFDDEDETQIYNKAVNFQDVQINKMQQETFVKIPEEKAKIYQQSRNQVVLDDLDDIPIIDTVQVGNFDKPFNQATKLVTQENEFKPQIKNNENSNNFIEVTKLDLSILSKPKPVVNDYWASNGFGDDIDQIPDVNISDAVSESQKSQSQVSYQENKLKAVTDSYRSNSGKWDDDEQSAFNEDPVIELKQDVQRKPDQNLRQGIQSLSFKQMLKNQDSVDSDSQGTVRSNPLSQEEEPIQKSILKQFIEEQVERVLLQEISKFVAEKQPTQVDQVTKLNGFQYGKQVEEINANESRYNLPDDDIEIVDDWDYEDF